MLEDIIEYAINNDVEVLTFTGLDSAIVGYNYDNNIVVYSEEKIIEHFMKEDGMSYEDAYEHFSYNTKGSYMGENTPLIIKTFN